MERSKGICSVALEGSFRRRQGGCEKAGTLGIECLSIGRVSASFCETWGQKREMGKLHTRRTKTKNLREKYERTQHGPSANRSLHKNDVNLEE